MKQVKVLTGIAVAALSTGTGLVQADDLSNTRPTKAAEVVTHTEVTESQVADAKTKAAEATKAVKDQEATVKAAEAEKTQAQQSFVEATTAVNDAEKLASEATPDGITQAQEAIEAAQETTTAAPKDVAVKTQALEQAKKAVSRQETKVADQKVQVDKASETVAKAQEAVAAAQATLDGTNQAQVLKTADQAQTDLEQAKATEKTAEANLLNAQEADQKRAEALTQAEKEVTSAQTELATVSKAFNEATQKATDSQIALLRAEATHDQAKNVVNSLEEEIKMHNTITLPEGYKEALEAYYTTKSEVAKERLNELTKEAVAINQYQSVTPFDIKDNIEDPRKLSEQARTELTLFAVDLLNQVRKAMGTQEVVANKSAITFADEVANTSKVSGYHDVAAINEAAVAFGLESFEGYNLYENLGIGYFDPTGVVTMDFLKEGIYRALVNMLLNDNDSNWGHAFSLAGLGDASHYIGVDAGYVNTINGRIHILGVADHHIKESSLFDTTANLSARNL
ncbi:SEC10/PgrA surface exclusion domain-containing protein, partial [Streptococcus canis]|uniref:SEC10/PgrA surface exclusion domain-containing protein n=1 Tax=Streptococcus canis TaxID=1329 RepID=UPI0040351929